MRVTVFLLLFSGCYASFIQSEWLLLSDNVNDFSDLIVNPSINKTYAVWSENDSDEKNIMWGSYLPYNYDDAYIVQVNKIGYETDISTLGYNPLIYDNKENPSIMVYVINNTMNILLSETFGDKWTHVYAKKYTTQIEDLSITPDYENRENKDEGEMKKNRNWLLCYTLRYIVVSSIECLYSSDGKIWSEVEKFPYKDCSSPIVYTVDTNRWNVISDCFYVNEIRTYREIYSEIHKTDWISHFEYSEYEYIHEASIKHKQTNYETDHVILLINHIGISQMDNSSVIFERGQSIPNSSRDVTHYHSPNKWLIITSSYVTQEYKGIELHIYDDVKHVSVLLGTIFNNTVDDVKIYNLFNGYYGVILKTYNMLLYTVLYFDDIKYNIFDSYKKQEIEIRTNSIRKENSTIDADQIYICSDETVVDMKNIKLSNVNLDIRCNVNIRGNITIVGQSNINISKNLSINGNLVVHNNPQNNSILNFYSRNGKFDKIMSDSQKCYDAVYDTYDIYLEQCDTAKNKTDDKSTLYIVVIFLLIMGVLSIISVVVALILIKRPPNVV